MKIKMPSVKRTAYIAVAFGLAVAGLVQGVLVEHAYALPSGGQLLNRQITISSSAPGATGADYRVAFLPVSNYAIKGIIVDFCVGTNTPIIGDTTCNTPAGFDIGTPTVDTTPGLSGYDDLGDGTGTWTATDHGAANHTLRLTNPNGPTLNSANANRYAFVISGVTNPSSTGTFYARIITYTLDTGEVVSYAPGTEGSTNARDYGGIALSTANVINIQAKVQESLTFCVSEADPTPGCQGTTVPALVLGHGTNNILDESETNTDVAFMQASTNAQSGITVRMKNSNACGGLSRNGGTTCEIAARGATAGAISPGNTPAPAYFGMYVGGAGLTATAPYNAGTTQYGMDTTVGSGVTSTYGSEIASSTGTLSNVENTLTFAATATNTTPAGLYSANIIINATGTF